MLISAVTLGVSALGSLLNAASTKTTAQKIAEANAARAQVQKADTTQTTEEFMKFAKMSPAQRIREAYLKSHNLTEEQLATLDPKEREKIEEAIKQEIKTKLGLNDQHKTGAIMDVSV